MEARENYGKSFCGTLVKIGPKWPKHVFKHAKLQPWRHEARNVLAQSPEPPVPPAQQFKNKFESLTLFFRTRYPRYCSLNFKHQHFGLSIRNFLVHLGLEEEKDLQNFQKGLHCFRSYSRDSVIYLKLLLNFLFVVESRW